MTVLQYQFSVANFTVGTGDTLWSAILAIYGKISSKHTRRDGSDALVPNYEMVVSFVVKAVGETGKAFQDWPGTAVSALVVDLEEGHPIHTAALAFASENGGQANLGRAAIKITGIRLNNKLVEEQAAEGA